MDVTQAIIVAGILSIGILVQSAVGFGTGLFSIPLMLLCGIDLPVAIAALLAAVTVQTAYGTWRYRSHVPWRTSLQVTFWRYTTLPLGVYTLTFLADAGRDRAKQIVGTVLLLVLIAQWLFRGSGQADANDSDVESSEPVEQGRQQSRHLHPGWAPLAGALSGFMGGAFGMGGPPVVIWTMAHDWPSRQSRAFLWSTFLLLMPPQLALLSWAFGWTAIRAVGVGLLLAPLMILAATAGAWLGDHLDRHRLRTLAFTFLVMIAASAIITPLL